MGFSGFIYLTVEVYLWWKLQISPFFISNLEKSSVYQILICPTVYSHTVVCSVTEDRTYTESKRSPPLTQACRPPLIPAKSKLKWIRFTKSQPGVPFHVPWGIFQSLASSSGTVLIDQVLSVLSDSSRAGGLGMASAAITGGAACPRRFTCCGSGNGSCEGTLWGPLTLCPTQGGLWCSRHAQ